MRPNSCMVSTAHRTSLKNMLELAIEHQTWQQCHWRPLLFTDESRFHISTCDQCVWVWRQHGECFAASNIVAHDALIEGPWWYGGACLWMDARTCMCCRGATLMSRDTEMISWNPLLGCMQVLWVRKSLSCMIMLVYTLPCVPAGDGYSRDGLANQVTILEPDRESLGHSWKRH